MGVRVPTRVKMPTWVRFPTWARVPTSVEVPDWVRVPPSWWLRPLAAAVAVVFAVAGTTLIAMGLVAQPETPPPPDLIAAPAAPAARATPAAPVAAPAVKRP